MAQSMTFSMRARSRLAVSVFVNQTGCCTAANEVKGHKQPPALQKRVQKRLGQGQTFSPDRDRLTA
jgi:hypothetical protein